MEGDCLQVINILSTGANSLASFGASIDASLASSSNFSSLFFRFVKHSGNALAHDRLFGLMKFLAWFQKKKKKSIL